MQKVVQTFHNIEFEVLAVTTEGMVISVTEGQFMGGIGESINIQVFGAKHTVIIEIVDKDDEVIEILEFPATDTGEVNQPWIIPNDIEPGTYTVKAEDAFNSAETTYTLR